MALLYLFFSKIANLIVLYRENPASGSQKYQKNNQYFFHLLTHPLAIIGQCILRKIVSFSCNCYIYCYIEIAFIRERK